ncbi:MAG: hypothetical protein ACYSX0_14915, partial [Planctomycetota bacterium]
MRKFRTDKRIRDVVASPEAAKAVEEAGDVLGPNEIKAALGLATVEKNRSYILEEFVSVQAWAKPRGYEEQQTNRLLALGRVLLAEPALLKRVRAGKVTRENAVTLGRALRELKPTGEAKKEWLDKAETFSTKELRDRVEKAIEDSRQGKPTFPMRLQVTKAAKDGFHRVRDLMSNGKRPMLTEGQTFGRLVDYWRDRNDPFRVKKPKRRRGPTRGSTGRYVPRQVVWAVERRSKGTCEICGVRRAKHKMHLKTPHARGGGREESDLGHGCPECHFFYDCGVIVFDGFDDQGRLRWRFNPDALSE